MLFLNNGIKAQSNEVLTGPFLDSTNYVPPISVQSSLNRINSILHIKEATIGITHYKQCGGSWSNKILGTCTSSVCSAGCAMTDAAMLLNANGVNVSPGELNTWLTNNGGYANGCDLYWTAVTNYPGATLNWYASMTFSLSTLKSEIDGGNPVIVKVDHAYGGSSTCHHWVLVYGYTNEGTSSGDFLVSDPGTVNCPSGCNLSYYSICATTYPLRLYHNVSYGTAATVPANDSCSNAILLTSSTSANYLYRQTVNYATASGKPKESCDAFIGTPDLADVWYSFKAQSTSHLITVDPYGSELDAVIAVYNSCSDSSSMKCSDVSGGAGVLSTLELSGLTVGNNYYIRVYNYGRQTTNGSFRIAVTHAPTKVAITNVTFPDSIDEGSKFDIHCTIQTTADMNVLLGALLTHNSINYSDVANDNLISLNPTPTNLVTRSFDLSVAVPNPMPVGDYYVTVSLWTDKNGNGIIDPNIDEVLISYTSSQKLTINHTSATTVSANIKIYPNPTTGMFEISDIETLDCECKVEVFNNLGCLVYISTKQKIDKKISLDLSSYSAGVYVIKLSGNGATYKKKIVKI